MTIRIRNTDGKIHHVPLREVVSVVEGEPTTRGEIAGVVHLRSGQAFMLRDVKPIIAALRGTDVQRDSEALEQTDSVFGRIFDGPNSVFGKIFG